MSFRIIYKEFCSITLNHEVIYKEGNIPGLCTDLEFGISNKTKERLLNHRIKTQISNGQFNFYNKTNEAATIISTTDADSPIYITISQKNSNFNSYTEPFFDSDELNKKIYHFHNVQRSRLTEAVDDKANSNNDFIPLLNDSLDLNLPADTARIDFITNNDQVRDRIDLIAPRTGISEIDLANVSEGVYRKVRFYDSNDVVISEEEVLFYTQDSQSAMKIIGIIELYFPDFSIRNYSIIFGRKQTKWMYLLGHDANYTVRINWTASIGKPQEDIYTDNGITFVTSNNSVQSYKDLVDNLGSPHQNYKLTTLITNNPLPASNVAKTGIIASIKRIGQTATTEIKNLPNPDPKSRIPIQNEDYLSHFIMIPKNYQN